MLNFVYIGNSAHVIFASFVFLTPLLSSVFLILRWNIFNLHYALHHIHNIYISSNVWSYLLPLNKLFFPLFFVLFTSPGGVVLKSPDCIWIKWCYYYLLISILKKTLHKQTSDSIWLQWIGDHFLSLIPLSSPCLCWKV